METPLNRHGHRQPLPRARAHEDHPCAPALRTSRFPVTVQRPTPLPRITLDNPHSRLQEPISADAERPRIKPTSSAAVCAARGMGLHLVRKYPDRIDYRCVGDRNILTLEHDFED